MRLPHKDRVLSSAVVLALAAVLVVLAVLQYRWSQQVSEAASDRLKSNLQTAMMHFRDGLGHELGGIALALHFDSQSTEPAVYVQQIEQWKQTAAYPDLIANLYIWKADGKRSRFLRLNFKTQQFEPCPAPSGFGALTEPLQEFASHAASSERPRHGEWGLAGGRRLPVQGPDPHGPAENGSPASPEQVAAAAAPPESRRTEQQTQQSSSDKVSGGADRKADPEQLANGPGFPEPAQQTAEASAPEDKEISQRDWGREGLRRGLGRNFGRPYTKQGLFSAFGASTVRPDEPRNPSGFSRRSVSVGTSGQGRASTGGSGLFDRPFLIPERPFDRHAAAAESAPAFARGRLIPLLPVSPEEIWGANNAPELPSSAAPRDPAVAAKAGAVQRQMLAAARARFVPWFVEESIPALLRPQLSDGPDARSDAFISPQGDWIVVELNRKVLQEHVFPELAERYFAGPQGLIYDVAVKRQGQNDLIYSSGSGFGKDAAAGDAQVALFGPPGAAGGPGGPLRVLFAGEQGSREGPPEDGPGWVRHRRAGPRLLPFQSGQSGGWELLARHRKGSLEAAVTGMRRRNLGISFGVLLILGVTMAMVIVTTRRAQRLAMLQMDFVAGVSHELRTPLAVISSAADNIADGIVSDKTRLARYGKLIHDHTRQLTYLVEQILSFAATRQHNQQFNLVRVQPAEFVETALRNSAEMIRNAGFTLEQEIDPNLPAVVVDVPAVTHCLQNLISNAVKYGGDQHWLRVRAHRAEREVQISVEDKGIGMESQDLQRIFDPFYRAPSVVAAQIHGTGLGLALARSMADAVGGRLTVASKPGKGSTFVLHLPAADEHTSEQASASAGNGPQYSR